MKPIITISIGFVLLFTVGCSESSGPEEPIYLRIGEGYDPVWVPDNSAVTARNLSQSTAGALIGQEFLLFFSPTGNKLLDKKQLSEANAPIRNHAWSHDNTDPSLAYSIYDSDSRIYSLMRLDDIDGTPVKLYESTQPIQSPSWSSDNSKIVLFHLGEPSQILHVDSNGGEPTAIISSQGWGFPLQLRFARCAVDGPYLVYAAQYPNESQNIFRIDISGGEPTKLTDFEDSETAIYCTEMSPDGNTLAYIMKHSQTEYQFVYLQAVSGGEPVKVIETAFDTFAPHWRRSEHLSWSPDGQKIVVGTHRYDGAKHDYGIYIVPLDEYLGQL